MYLEREIHSPEENGGLCQFNKDLTRRYHICEVQPDGGHRGWVETTERPEPAAHPEAAASAQDHPEEAVHPEAVQH